MAGEIVDSVEMLRRLVAFDTTSRNSNLALIEYVQDYLEGHGIESKLVPSEDGKKANLFATVGPERRRTASCCRAIPTSCRSTASRGTPIRGR